jgi:ATP-dependent Lhr-like helicase
VQGLGGAQFALPGAVELLRSLPPGDAESPLVLAAVDPAQPYGAALPWPKRDGEEGRRGPTRVPGAYVVLAGGEPVLYLERGGKGLLTLVDPDDARLEPALAALADQVRRGAIKRIALEHVDREPALASPLGPRLIALGFREGPRKLTLSA